MNLNISTGKTVLGSTNYSFLDILPYHMLHSQLRELGERLLEGHVTSAIISSRRLARAPRHVGRRLNNGMVTRL